MRENKGFTLVELIVSISILSIVGLAVVGFMTTSSKTYANANEEVSIQYESQLAINQLRDLVIDANRGVAYGLETSSGVFHLVDESDPNKKETKLLAELEAANPAEKGKIKRCMIIYNEKKTGAVYKYPVVKITWEPATGKLQYAFKTFAAVADINVASINDDKLLADSVQGFTADLSKINKSEVKFDVLFKTGGKQYATKPTVTLRNKVIVSENPEDIYDGTPVPKDSFVLSIQIKKNGVHILTDTLMVGTSAAYTAAVEVQYGADTSVIWDLIGASHSTMTNGVVSISPDETASIITLQATSVADKSKKAILPITVQEDTTGYVISMALEEKEGNIQTSPSDGASKQYDYPAKIVYYNEANLSAAEKGVTYTYAITKGTPPYGSYSFNSATGSLWVNYRANKTEFTIKAVTKGKTKEGIKITDQVVRFVDGLAGPDNEAPRVEINPNNETLIRGSNIEFTAKTYNMVNPKFSWEIIEYIGFDNGIANKKNNLVAIKNNKKGKIDCDSELDWGSEFKVAIRVTATGSNQTRAVSAPVLVPIGAVELRLKSSQTNMVITKGNVERDFLFEYTNIKVDKNLSDAHLISGVEMIGYDTDTENGIPREQDFKRETFVVSPPYWDGCRFTLSDSGNKEFFTGNYEKSDLDYFEIRAYTRYEGSAKNVVSNPIKFTVEYKEW